MKVLLLGARGYLGSYLVKYVPKNIDLIISARDKTNIPDNMKFVKIDIVNKNELIQAVLNVNPDVIINCIAISQPDVAEKKKELTYKTNVTGVANIIEACNETNSKLIQISTDNVFSGKKGNYDEEDDTGPINHYGYTKLEAEKLIINSNIKYLICRTAVLIGLKDDYHRNNLFYSFYLQFKEKKEVKAFKTQIGSPTLVDDLAMCIYNLIYFNKSGIYHTVGYESLSRYEFAQKMAEIYGFREDLIISIKEGSLKRPALRPQNSSLDASKIKEEFNIKFRGIKQALLFLKKQIEDT